MNTTTQGAFGRPANSPESVARRAAQALRRLRIAFITQRENAPSTQQLVDQGFKPYRALVGL